MVRVNRLARSTFHVVLLSGGIDSATALAVALHGADQVSALHFSYGQRAATQERLASADLARHFGVPWRPVEITGGPSYGRGEIVGRNAVFLNAALMLSEIRHGTISIGIHSGTGYADCEPAFIDVMQRLFEYHTQGNVGIATPFLSFTKSEVYRLAVDAGVPINLTYSCEEGTIPPCGICRSCGDRRGLDASAKPDHHDIVRG